MGLNTKCPIHHNEHPDFMCFVRKMPLRDFVLSVLSLAAKRGRGKIQTGKFFQAFAVINDEFSSALPLMAFTKTGHSAYSRKLDIALAHWTHSGIDFVMPNHIEVQDDAADRYLIWLREKYGDSMIDGMEPIVDIFCEAL